MGERKDKWLADKKARQVRELDFRRIEFSDLEIAKARAVAAAGACEPGCHERSMSEDAHNILEHLGLMPNQDAWYYKERDPHTPRPEGSQ